ncbi:DUF6461 domain-containing protein [Streptomyces sp. NBC_00370]|uniref:DUF6461 domain-containing protein n=1 Tax=Streptomyces sp. NBC_00370 TaxID=2975728 RepID=UPI002E25AB9D
MAGGIGWLLEPYVVDCVTFARGIGPVDLVLRLGARGGPPARSATAEEAMDLLTSPGVDSVARVGTAGEWAYAVEYGDAVGWTRAGLAEASRDGAEVVNFLLTPWHPPSMFNYYRDGVRVCSFGIGEEAHRWGQDRDLLLPALSRAGVLPGRRARSGADREHGRLLSVLTVGEHFGLQLPREDIVEGRLPLYLVRER